MDDRILQLDRSLCILISMGRVLTAVTTLDQDILDPTCLPDLGHVISNEADAALSLLHQIQGGNDDQLPPFS